MQDQRDVRIIAVSYDSGHPNLRMGAGPRRIQNNGLHADPRPLAQGSAHPLPGAIQAPEAEVVVDGLPKREVVGQESPGAAAFDDVEDGVEYLAQAMETGTPTVVGRWRVPLKARPFGIGKVGRVRSSHEC